MSANNYNVPIIQILRNQLIAFTILEDLIWQIYGHLSRCSTARGSSSGFSLVGPTKVKARKSFLFTEGFLKVENNKSLRLRRSLVKLLELAKTVTNMVTGCLKAIKVSICALKSVL